MIQAILTYDEAAEVLMIGYDAVRMRAMRGSLTPAEGVAAVVIDEKLLSAVPAGVIERVLAARAVAAQAGPLGAMLSALPLYPWVPDWYRDQGYENYIGESCHYVLRVLREVARGRMAARRWGWDAVDTMYADSISHLQRATIGGEPLHNVGFGNVAYFRRRLQPMRKLREVDTPWRDEMWVRALRSLVSDKVGNRNAARAELHRTLIQKIWADEERQVGLGALPNVKTVHERYILALGQKRQELHEAGLPTHERDFEPYTLQNLYHILNGAKSRLLLGGTRYGKAWALREAAPHHHRGRPAPWAVATADGVSLGTLVAPGPGSSRRRSESLYVWIWRDWGTGATIGYSFGRGGESPAMVIEALGDVYRRWGRLPHTVQIDDKMRHKGGMDDFFGRLGIRMMGKEAYRPQGLMAETGNRELNRVHRKLDPDWVNRTAHSDDYRRVWEDLRTGKEIKTEAEARALVDEMVAVMNGTRREWLGGRTSLEALAAAGAKPGPVDTRYLRWYFGARRKATVRRGVIQVTPALNGEVVQYVLEDYTQYLPHDARRLEVYACWYQDDYETVDVFRLDGTWLATCGQVQRYNPDPLSQTDEDRRIIAAQSAEVARYYRAVEQMKAHIDDTLEMHDMDMDAVRDYIREHYLATEREAGQLPVAVAPDPELEEEEGDITRRRPKVKYDILAAYGRPTTHP